MTRNIFAFALATASLAAATPALSATLINGGFEDPLVGGGGFAGFALTGAMFRRRRAAVA